MPAELKEMEDKWATNIENGVIKPVEHWCCPDLEKKRLQKDSGATNERPSKK